MKKEITVEELESRDREIQDEIDIIAEKMHLGLTIKDGIYSAEKYLSAPLRLMWVLKEPYDADGGGWSITKDLFANPVDFSKNGHVSAKVITRLSYCLLNNKKFADSKDLGCDSEVVYALQNIALINISKLPGTTTTDNATLSGKYEVWKTILLKQINLYSPDIIIFGNTFGYFLSDLFKDVSLEIKYRFGMATGFLWGDKLLISANHPGYAKSEEKQDDYASEIIKIVDKWKSQNKKDGAFAAEKNLDYRVSCIADCLSELEKMLGNRFGIGNVQRVGNGGDDIYWGRWADNATTYETIADWLLAKNRRNEIGYAVDLKDGFKAEVYLTGDAKTFASYIFAPEDLLKKAESKREEIDEKFGVAGWWISGNFAESRWIIGGPYGGDFNGVNLSFDFRNASMAENEYKEAYKEFKEKAIQGIISGRDDSIKKAAEELKTLLK